MRPDARAWFRQRTTAARSLAELDVPTLLRAKRRGGHRISVVLPARDEEETVGRLVGEIAERWMRRVPLVDELVVVDSDSTDRTAAVARAAGADVVATTALLSASGTRPGKGEALWKSLAATTGDLLVFLDADLLGDVGHYVPALLGPLLGEPETVLVKGCYTRPLERSDGLFPDPGDGRSTAGGRVTELTARPLLNALWPELAGVVQPLGGEYAARRSALEQVPFAGGYGVDVGLLLDLAGLAGLAALAQVDLGVRRHGSQDEAALGVMAGQVLAAMLARAAGDLAPGLRAPSGLLTRFERKGVDFVPRTSSVALPERPPLATLAEYRALREETRPAG